jgi:hypothetical protein
MAKKLFLFTSLDREDKTLHFLQVSEQYLENLETEKEVPSEFCDPLLCTPIVVPVALPGSELIMDRAVLERYLLEKQEDPFSRSPLTITTLNDFNKSSRGQELLSKYNLKYEQWKSESSSSDLSDLHDTITESHNSDINVTIEVDTDGSGESSDTNST